MTDGPPEIPAPPPWPGVGPGFPVALVLDPERFGPAAGKSAVIRELTPWGAVLSTGWGTGETRVRFDEITPALPAPRPTAPAGAVSVNGKAAAAELVAAARRAAKAQGYMGDPCPTCGALKLRGNGAAGCLICDGCGTSSGCS